MKIQPFISCIGLFIIVSCNSNGKKTTSDTQDKPDTSHSKSINILPLKDAFTATIDGKKTDLFILKNNSGMQAAVTNYGGRLIYPGIWKKDFREN